MWIDGRSTDVRWGDFDEEHRLRPLLHLRHHGQPQGRALFAPLQRAARLVPMGKDALGCGAADVVLPVVPMFHANAWGLVVVPGWRRQAGDARAPSSTAPRSTNCSTREGHLHGRRADGVAHAADAPAREQPQAAPPEARHHRRLGGAGSHPARLRGRLRRRGDPRLGHDRNEPAGHARQIAWAGALDRCPIEERISRS
jgi:hypothetical protein